LRKAMQALVERLDHRFLNDVAPFDQSNPSAENLAKYFSDEMTTRITDRGLRVEAVTVWETDLTSATYRPRDAT
jgi:6-pyruvoyltetrahydropterin/6-carboxytetrahydropterin synthase